MAVYRVEYVGLVDDEDEDEGDTYEAEAFPVDPIDPDFEYVESVVLCGPAAALSALLGRELTVTIAPRARGDSGLIG